jgi:hypothetical protein
MILPHRANPQGCDFRERQVVAPHFLQAYVKSHRSVSSETATGGDGVIGRLQPGQVTVG